MGATCAARAWRKALESVRGDLEADGDEVVEVVNAAWVVILLFPGRVVVRERGSGLMKLMSLFGRVWRSFSLVKPYGILRAGGYSVLRMYRV